MSGSPMPARLSRVERPAGTAARLFSDVAAVAPRGAGRPGPRHRPLGGVEVAAGDEVVGQGPGLVAGPGLEGGDELGLLDQAVLQGEQPEQEVAVGGHGATSRRGSGTARRLPPWQTPGRRPERRIDRNARGDPHASARYRRGTRPVPRPAGVDLWIGSHGRGEGRPNSVGAAPNRARMTRVGLSSRCSRSGGLLPRAEGCWAARPRSGARAEPGSPPHRPAAPIIASHPRGRL